MTSCQSLCFMSSGRVGAPRGRDLARMSPQSQAFEPQSIVQIRPMAARLVAKFGFQKKHAFREIPSCSLHFCLFGVPRESHRKALVFKFVILKYSVLCSCGLNKNTKR